jgi:hypothetical protein
MQRELYPLALSLTSALLTALGLMAAALGIQWGAAPPPGEALPCAWLDVNILWSLVCLIVWPAAALRNPLPFRWQWAAILVGALPSLGIAAFLSGVTVLMIAAMLALQFAAVLMVAGILRLRFRFPSVAHVLLILLTAATLAGPVAAFLWAEFFPLAPHGWLQALPLLAVAHAAQSPPEGSMTATWIIITLYTIAAGLLLLAAGARKAQQKAPGNELPRA